MNIWHDISPERITAKSFMAVVEIPKDCKIKYELDKETGLLRMDRVLHTATYYPANYGFIPRTYGDDNDPLDVLILSSVSVYPMTLIRCYAIGAIKMTDNDENDEKIIAIPFDDPNYNVYKDISELPKHLFEEMAHFFTVYKELEHKKTAVQEIVDPKTAVSIIEKSIEKYNLTFGKSEK